MATPRSQRCRVTRPYWYEGEPLGTGSVVDHKLADAIERRTAGQVDFVQADAKLLRVPLEARKPSGGPANATEARKLQAERAALDKERDALAKERAQLEAEKAAAKELPKADKAK